MATTVTKNTVPQTIVNPMRRLVSLDVVRGITIAFMILVNNGGSGKYSYRQLEHSPWNGWTLTDLVFPSFLFIAGISIVFSTESRLARGESKGRLRLHVLKRSVILFLLGLVVNGFPLFHLGTLRIYGVLQRIAICFCIASLLYLWNSKAWVAATTVVVALFGYWILMRWVPIPGIGVPTHNVPLLDPNLNWVAYVDRKIFPGRLYEVTRDPEGLLSNIPAMGTILLRCPHRYLAAAAKAVTHQSHRPAGCCAQRIGAGKPMEHLVPDQQEALDQLLCALRRGLHLVAAGDLLLCDRDQTMDARLDVPMVGLRVQCHYRVRFLGTSVRRTFNHSCA